MPWSVIWALVDQVLAGLAHAHARGVIHGDLKPSNVMLDLAGDGARPARVRARSRARVAARVASRLASRRRARARARGALGRRHGRLGRARADPQARRRSSGPRPISTRSAASSTACSPARRSSRATRKRSSARTSARPVPPPRSRDGVPPRRGAFVAAPPREEAVASLRVRGRRASRLGAVPSARTRRRSRRRVASAPSPPPAPSSHAATWAARSPPRARSRRASCRLRPSPMVAREEERQRAAGRRSTRLRRAAARRTAWSRSSAKPASARAASPSGSASRCTSAALMVPLRARYGRIAAPLDGVTGAVNAHFGLEGADRDIVEQTLINRWEVDQGRRRGALVGRRDRRVAPPDAAGHRARRVGPDRASASSSTRPSFAAPSCGACSSASGTIARSCSGSTICTTRRRTRSRCSRACIATRRSCACSSSRRRAARRSRPISTRRCAWKRCAPTGAGEVLELTPLGDRRDRGAPPRDAAAPRRRGRARASRRAAATRSSRSSSSTRGRAAATSSSKADSTRCRTSALDGRAITTAELWDERLRAVPDRSAPRAPTRRRRSATTSAATCSRRSSSALGMDPRDALVALTRAQILLASGNDQFRWPHALLQEHLLERLHERNDAPAIFRLAANALAKHPAVGSRRIMKHRVREPPPRGRRRRRGRSSCSASSRASWARGRDTAATLRDLALLDGRVHGRRRRGVRATGAPRRSATPAGSKRRASRRRPRAARSQHAGDTAREAHCAAAPRSHRVATSGAPAQGARCRSRARSRASRSSRTIAGARAVLVVVLGEIDYLLGEHARARAVLLDASRSAATRVGDSLGRAQCLILLAMIETAVGGFRRARELLVDARAEFDAHRLSPRHRAVRRRARPRRSSRGRDGRARARGRSRRARRSASCRTRAARRRASACSR